MGQMGLVSVERFGYWDLETTNEGKEFRKESLPVALCDSNNACN